MASVAARDLRKHTRQVLDRVTGGETVVQRVLGHQADAALTAELAELAPDASDDLPW
jgi:hypothetical protein